MNAKMNFRMAAIVLLSLGLVGLGMGCKSAEPEKAQPAIPVFFPSPPSKTRLQFLKSFARPEHVNAEKPSSFETFLFGEPEKEEFVIKSYGVAIYKGKIYVCDTGGRCVVVMDDVNHTYGYFPLDRRMSLPFNIFIEPDGTKYITDPAAGAVFVYDDQDKPVRTLASGMGYNPRDICVKGDLAYITDSKNTQVVVLDKMSGKLIRVVGRLAKSSVNISENEPGDFGIISDLSVDSEGNIYVSDLLRSQVLKYDAEGKFLRAYSGPGNTEANLMRPKGIAIDREDRIWVADSGPAEAVKIYNQDGQFLLMFGTHGKEPGRMFMPTKVVIDYDNLEHFKQYAVEGAKLEYLILVTNQFGPNKVNVYGFGSFPEKAVLNAEARSKEAEKAAETESLESESTESESTESNLPES